jgi:hypothetical protein
LKALLARKRRFETISIKNSLEGASIPCSKNPLRSVQQKTESPKYLAYVWVAKKERGTEASKETQSENYPSARGAYL